MKITKNKLKTLLLKEFPNLWIKEGCEFRHDYKNSLWTGEGSTLMPYGCTTELPVFDRYDLSDKYEMGVHVDLVQFLDKYGLYAEAYDSGTYFIFIN